MSNSTEKMHKTGVVPMRPIKLQAHQGSSFCYCIMLCPKECHPCPCLDNEHHGGRCTKYKGPHQGNMKQTGESYFLLVTLAPFD